MQNCKSRLRADGADGVLGTGDLWKERHELLTVVSEFLSAHLTSPCSGHEEWLTRPECSFPHLSESSVIPKPFEGFSEGSELHGW